MSEHQTKTNDELLAEVRELRKEVATSRAEAKKQHKKVHGFSPLRVLALLVLLTIILIAISA